MSIFDIFNPLFMPLVQINDIFAIAVIALVITLVINLAQKRFTDQALMKELRADMKKLQQKMKHQKDNPDKMMAIQKDMLEKNSAYMKQSFKPMLITFIPIMLIFGWVGGHLSYLPIEPNEPFMVSVQMEKEIFGEVVLLTDLQSLNSQRQNIVDGKAMWELQGEAGEYDLTYEFNGEMVSQSVLITSELEYADREVRPKSDQFKKLRIENEPRRGFILFRIPMMLGLYIIFSIVFSIIMRKLLGLA